MALEEMLFKLDIFYWNRCDAWHCKGNPDAADAANESNPYMSPFLATQKVWIYRCQMDSDHNSLQSWSGGLKREIQCIH